MHTADEKVGIYVDLGDFHAEYIHTYVQRVAIVLSQRTRRFVTSLAVVCHLF